MTITIRIHPDAFDTGGPLAGYESSPNWPAGKVSLQFPVVPLPIGVTGTTGAPGPGFIASAPDLHFRRNILENGAFPVAPGSTQDVRHQIFVHVSPTSGSVVLRGGPNDVAGAEFHPAYGLNIGIGDLNIEDSVFESAIKDPVGAGLMASLQDLVERAVIEVAHDGTPMDATDIGDFSA